MRKCGVLPDHGLVFKVGLDLDVFMGSTLVNTYLMFQLMRDAQKLFEELSVRDAVLWKAMVVHGVVVKMGYGSGVAVMNALIDMLKEDTIMAVHERLWQFIISKVAECETIPVFGESHIRDLPSLERLLREEGREILPYLTSLEIQNCPNLTFPCLPSLKFLEVLDCNEELLRSISNLSSLTSLSLYNNNELICLPQQGMLQNLTSLESISISHCNELESFPEQSPEGLNRLKKLSISERRKFTSLPDGLQYLSSLESFTLSCCPELVSLPNGIRHLSSLQSLMMSGQYTSGYSLTNPIGCPKLAVLPEALQHVAALQSLHISGYPDLASLPHWLGDLTSLHSLIIVGCPKLSSLPTCIQSLTNLQKLAISQCPELMKRCKKEIGEDWYKIAHVPNVSVDPVALTEVEPSPIELKFDPLQIH